MAGITINVFLVLTNMLILQDLGHVILNVLSGGLCYIGYRTSIEDKNGDE